jgi:hypothetical protein
MDKIISMRLSQTKDEGVQKIDLINIYQDNKWLNNVNEHLEDIANTTDKVTLFKKVCDDLILPVTLNKLRVCLTDCREDPLVSENKGYDIVNYSGTSVVMLNANENVDEGMLSHAVVQAFIVWEWLITGDLIISGSTYLFRGVHYKNPPAGELAVWEKEALRIAASWLHRDHPLRKISYRVLNENDPLK